jgi:nitrogen fixation protein NifU and related proteins
MEGQEMDQQEESGIRERLRNIYSEVTIDHILRPRNTEDIPNADGFAVCRSGCGETMKIWLQVRNDRVQETSFWTNGCAATIACGSMCTELAKDRSIPDAFGISAETIAVALVDLPEGNLHCAELAADALRAALKDCLSVRQQPWKRLYRK